MATLDQDRTAASTPATATEGSDTPVAQTSRTRNILSAVTLLTLSGCYTGPIPTVSGSSDSTENASSGSTTGETADTATGTTNATSNVDSGPTTSTTSADDGSSTGPAEVCGNGVIEGGEVCDGMELGEATCESEDLGVGTLTCNADCTLDGSGCMQCGDGEIDEAKGEVCDGTELGENTSCADLGPYVDAPLTCLDDCSYDEEACEPLCGNEMIDPGEQCDGDNLNGFTCEMLGQVGEPVCLPTCMVDPASCMPQGAEGEVDDLTEEEKIALIAQYYAERELEEASYPESQ